MTSASFILAAAVLAPGAMLLGLSATAAFSIAVAAGILAIAIADYGKSPADFASTRTLSYAATRITERLPLAA